MTGLRGQEREICTEAAERPHDPGQGSPAKPPEQEADSGPAVARRAPDGAGARLRPEPHPRQDLPAR